MANSFYIEGKEIQYTFDALASDEMLIQSMPYNYTVKFVKQHDLQVEINSVAGKNADNHFVFIDEIVGGLYGEKLFTDQELFTFLAVEENKILPTVTNVLDKLQEKNFSKKEMLLSVGGGITQDISAFVRAVYKRGINWTYIPTTLLAMGDSCIGAKSCLNYGHIKNQLGLFSSPNKVFICTDMLKTLDQRDVLSGYGEILKLSIVGGPAAVQKFSELVHDQNGDVLHNIDQLIKLSLIIKKSVIEIDEFENDIRKALNYGHTVGHAIEPLVNYTIPHGIAVSLGMVIENLISAKYGTLSKAEAETINQLILSFIDEKSISLLKDISVDAIIDNMKKDKKSSNNEIFMAVPFKIGSFDLLKLEADEALKQFLTVSLQSIQNN